jgi:hypothetical protein
MVFIGLFPFLADRFDFASLFVEWIRTFSPANEQWSSASNAKSC